MTTATSEIDDALWKQAAAQGAQTNEDTEKAFLDAAYAAIANKATPIMRSPYRVGFEIVFKNDDNTRIVGVFVFRVGKELYYAPVFFLNGSIKGTELFYRVNAKRFVPLTNEWVEYLISLSGTSEGQGIPISERAKARNQLNLYQIIEPPNSSSSRKYANAGYEPPFIVEAKKEAAEIRAGWEDFHKSIPKLAEDSILRRFLVEDGGRDALAKIARACERSFEFAQALALSCKEEDFMPEIPEQEKAASAPQELLRLHTGLLFNPGIKAASLKPEQLAKGYWFEDLRKEADVNKVVYTSSTQELVSPDQPGIYKVMLHDGAMHEMLCGYYKNIGITNGSCGPGSPVPCGSTGYYDSGLYPRGKSQQLCLVDLDSKASYDFNSEYKKPLCQFVRTLDPDKSERTEGGDNVGVEKPTSGKGYRIFNTRSQTLSEPFYVVSTKSSDGVTRCKVSDGYRLDQSTEIVINPDYAGQDDKEKVFGKCCRFVEVASEKMSGKDGMCGREVSFDCELKLGDQHALNRMIFDNGFKEASVKKRNAAWLVELDGVTHGEFTKLAATAFLMTHCDMTEEAADEVLAKVTGPEGRFGFFFEPLLTKSALNMRFNQWPTFYESTNSDYNVLQEPHTQVMIRADADRPIIERNRIGDRYSGGSANQDNTSDPNSEVETKSPMELYQMSQERGVGKMFEHGVVGALVNTYDSMAMLDKYMPDLEQALDRLGRILFLFYWKPEDFVQAFGSDDQSQMENKLISSFRSFGDLVLELLKKNQQSQQGTSSLT